jgi:hypothetical protein
MRKLVRWIVPLIVGLVGVAASAAEPTPVEVRPAQVKVGDVTFDGIWYLPQAVPLGFVVMEHGFSRRCENQVQTTVRVAEMQLAVLCITAPMAGGNPALAQMLATDIANGNLRMPDGAELPAKVLAAGYSAGGVFAARLAGALVTLAPGRLQGLLMLDPVAAEGLREGMLAVSSGGARQVLAITTNPSACNAFNSAHPDLLHLSSELDGAGKNAFVGLQLIRRSSHVDFEGEDSDAPASAVCGWPLRDNVEAARTLAAAWASDIMQGTRTQAYYPGGSYVERLIARDRAIPIAP